MNYKIGIFRDSAEQYNSEPHLRASVVKEMSISPGHFSEALKAPRKEKKSYDEGTVAHSVCLEQNTSGFVGLPEKHDGRTIKGKETLEKLQATGKIIISHDIFSSLDRRLDTFVKSQTAMSLYNGAEIEMSHYVKDPVTSLHLKARPDILKPGIIADFKTTENMANFEKQIWNYQYYIQVGFYAYVVELSTGTEFNSFYYIAQEKSAPYGVQVFSMNRDAVLFSKQKAIELLHRIAACTEMNSFPIYSDTIKQVEIPTWVLAKDAFSEEAI